MFKLFRVNWHAFSQQLSMEQFKKTKLTKLTDRSLLILNGPDSHKLLQGLMTNDVKQLKEHKQGEESFQKISLYTVFLQPKGKVITDAFVFKPRMYKNGKAEYASEELWIDVSKQAKNILKDHLKKHMWKKRVELVDVEKEAGEGGHIPTIYSGYNEESRIMSLMLGGSIELPELQEGEDQTYANLIYFDPRGQQFGLRIVSSQEQIEIEGHYEIANVEDHKRTYQRLGEVPHGLALNKLPFQFNYDLLNAISLKKGCYIGQQIVSRGLLTGIIRRRIFPFSMNPINGVFPLIQNDTLLKSNEEEIGKVLTYSNGQGLALVNYLPFLEKQSTWPLQISVPHSGTLFSPLDSKLQRYYTQMKGKQRKLQQLDL